MELKEAKQAFYDASDTLSENAGKLLFAGIAIIWILKVADKTAAGVPFSKDLYRPLLVFVLSLILDAAQYLYATVSWWLYHKTKHQEGLAETAEIDPPTVLTLPTWLFFAGKLFGCGFGYFYLVRYIWAALQQSPSHT
jgi:hypothetical protein